MRMVARLPLTGQHSGGRAQPLGLLFEHPTLAGFAAALERAGILTDTPPDPIPRLSPEARRPLSFAQERQWTLCHLDPGNAAYNIPAALRLNGALDAARLGRAFALLCDRHEVLRSRYPDRAGKPEVVLIDAPTAAQDTSLTAIAIAPEALDDRLRGDIAAPFDLAEGPLIRLRLYTTGRRAMWYWWCCTISSPMRPRWRCCCAN